MARTKREVTVSVKKTGAVYRIPKGVEVKRIGDAWAIARWEDVLKAGVAEEFATDWLWVVDSAVEE